jgi:phytoene/squalene synthetase
VVSLNNQHVFAGDSFDRELMGRSFWVLPRIRDIREHWELNSHYISRREG